MNDLNTWIAKRISWRAWGQRVTVGGVQYVPMLIAEELFGANQKLAARFSRERRRRKDAEAAIDVQKEPK